MPSLYRFVEFLDSRAPMGDPKVVLDEMRMEGPICSGTLGTPHGPVAVRANSPDLDVLTMNLAQLAERSDAFTCPRCGRHPEVDDWIDWAESEPTAMELWAYTGLQSDRIAEIFRRPPGETGD